MSENISKKNTFKTIMHRLSLAGFRDEFVRQALLPDWWDESCEEDPELVPDLEIRVARFMGFPLSSVGDPNAILSSPIYQGAQLRRVRDIDHDRLAPAIHSAIQIAGAVVRSLREPKSSPMIPPPDGFDWREMIEHGGATITLDDVLSDLWLRGIPVVPLELLPTPSFQAIVCVAEERPVILLSYKHDEPGRVAFLIVHEVGHIALGDCDPDHPVLDGEEGIIDNTDIEKRADQYARDVLVGDNLVPPLNHGEFKEMAKESARLEQETGVDAGIIISTWASRTRDYTKATMALKALYRSSGARQKTLQHFNNHVDLEAATESDRYLLRCVHGDAEWDETVARH